MTSTPPLLYFRDAGAISSLVALLQPGVELPSDLLKAVLKLLVGLAHDELSCEAIQQASGIPRVIKLLEYAKDDQVRLTALLPVATVRLLPSKSIYQKQEVLHALIQCKKNGSICHFSS